jgi:hypothetical protein
VDRPERSRFDNPAPRREGDSDRPERERGEEGGDRPEREREGDSE